MELVLKKKEITLMRGMYAQKVCHTCRELDHSGAFFLNFRPYLLSAFVMNQILGSIHPVNL